MIIFRMNPLSFFNNEKRCFNINEFILESRMSDFPFLFSFNILKSKTKYLYVAYYNATSAHLNSKIIKCNGSGWYYTQIGFECQNRIVIGRILQ